MGPHGLAIACGNDVWIRWDAEGRWCTYRRAERLYRRTLDGSVIVDDRDGLRDLPRESAAQVHREVREAACEMIRDLEGERIRIEGIEDIVRLRDCLRRVLAWSPSALAAEKNRFATAYPERVPILPPDRYRDIVLLPAVGCPHNHCTFCTLHRGTPFRVLGQAEFEQHMLRVGDLFGNSRWARDGLFLGSASALSLSRPDLTRVLDRCARTFGRPSRGIAAFFDPDHAPQHSAQAYREFAAHSLELAVIGLESGLLPLRKSLGKSGDLRAMRRAVAALKGAGVRCGLTVLVGAGGAAMAHRHREETARVLHDMELGPEDRVYLSPLLGPDLAGEVQALQATVDAATRARVVPYAMDRFRYFA